MIDGEQTDTTEAETSTSEATETAQTTEADNAATETTDDGEVQADKSLMTGGPDDETDDQTNDVQLPEKYELAAPEGMEIDEALLAEADPILRELKLDNEAANKLMPIVGKIADNLLSAQTEAFAAQASDWAKQAKADSEIGGKNWPQTEQNVARALDHFGAPEGSAFRTLLDDTKLGNHPEMIRMFNAIGAALGEGGDIARSDKGAPVQKDRLAALYPNDVPKSENA